MLINMGGMTCYASTDTIVRSTEKSNSLSYRYPELADVYAASSIAFMGAEWSSARQAWAFNYRFAGTASADWSSGTDADLIRMACMEINCTSNQDNAAFLDKYEQEIFRFSARIDWVRTRLCGYSK